MTPTLQILASGSFANCYVIDTPDEKLIIEAGVKPKEVLKALNYEVSKVGALICSHR